MKPASGSLLAMSLLAACSGVGNARPATVDAPPVSASASTSSPAAAASTPTVSELTALGEQMVRRHPVYGYYVSCVNFKENGAWPTPPAPVDYSACPITDELRDRMQATRADFYVTQNPARDRTVQVTSQPGGGVIVVTLAYATPIKLELVAVRSGPHYLVGDVVAKGDVTGRNPPPISFDEKPPTPAPTPPRPAEGSRVLDVPWYRQAYGLSCEEASLRMALAHQGIATTDAAILGIIGTDERPAYYDGGALHWGNPYTTFVGNPNGSEIALTGYGTYYPTLARAAAILGGQVLRSGERILPATLYSALLAGHPAVVWITYRWVPATRTDYVAFDGRSSPYAGPVEHAVTAVGISPTSILINDPLLGVNWIPRATFESAYATYNQMAVIIA